MTNNKEIQKNKLELAEELNPEYYNLYNECVQMMEEWSKIKKAVNNYKIDKIRIWKFYLPKVTPFNAEIRLKEISKIGNDVLLLQKKWLEWDASARKFCLSPIYKFSGDSTVDQPTSILYFSNILLSLISRGYDDIGLLVNDYNFKYSVIESEVIFWIAMTAWLLSMIGLIIAIIGLFISLV